VIEDYLLTNDAGNFEQFITKQRHSQLGLTDAHRPLLSLPDDVRRVLFCADADYLQSAFDRMDAELGGIAGYVETQLQIDRRTLQKIQERLLGEDHRR
jgi:protein tyrosine/serine phosphatase